MPRIPIDRIAPDPEQPRKIFAVADLETLAASIKQNGLIQPITVRPRPQKTGHYLIDTGERRWRAHKLLFERGERAYAGIEAIVSKATDTTSLRVKQIVENVARADMTALEEAQAYRSLLAAGLAAEEAADRIGISVYRFETRVSLLNLEPRIIKLVESGFDMNHAVEMARLPNHADQMKILQMINRGEIGHWRSVRQAVNALLESKTVSDLFGDTAVKASPADVATVTAMEEKIERVARLLSAGWKDGECIVANKVSPDRASGMADKLAAIRTTVRHMEKELRNVTAQARIVLAS